MVDKWHSRENIRSVKRPVLLIHGQSDRDISPWQSKILFLECAKSIKSQSAVDTDTCWKIRKGNDEQIKEIGDVDIIRNNEGEIWTFGNDKNVRLLLVKYAGHNSLSKFLIVEDAIVEFVSRI
jgi:fermentation-respiration switch protein FrsA (DUF1100 family)